MCNPPAHACSVGGCQFGVISEIHGADLAPFWAIKNAAAANLDLLIKLGDQAFAILQFIWVWNDLLIAKLFLSSENATVIVQLQGLLGTQGQGAELLTAGAFISMVLPVAVFFALQRYFVRGLTAGAVKG